MRENHLHCDKFPKAVFTGGTLTDLSAQQVVEGTPVTGTITGDLTNSCATAGCHSPPVQSGLDLRAGIPSGTERRAGRRAALARPQS